MLKKKKEKMKKETQKLGFYMDLKLVKKGLDYTRKKKKWVIVLAAFGFSGYGVYKLYHSPSLVKKRNRLFKLLGTLISVAEAVSDSAETVGVISKELKEFMQSESDQIPNSLRQVSKITRSDEFSESVIRVTRALTVGILGGFRSDLRNDNELHNNSSFSDRVMDKVFTPAGSGFASVVVGSFARNLVMAFYSNGECKGGSNLSNSGVEDGDLKANSVPRWVNVVCGDKCRELLGDSIHLFVSTAVAVYLDKTMHINTYDEIFSGLTNPSHETKVRDMLVSVCNGAMETLVKTTHQVLAGSNSDANVGAGSSRLVIIDQCHGPTENKSLKPEASSTELEVRNSFDENKDVGWFSKMSSTFAVPSNRRFVLDVTGKVTFETVRSFLEFLLEKLSEGLKGNLNVVHDTVSDRGLDVFRYLTAKSSVIVTICISLCLHIWGSAWVLMPA